MYKGKTFLGIIPARGGSKGLPRKNILPLNGKPLITWSIEAGQKSRYLDMVMVTTDDQDIAQTAKNAGAEVPFMRPADLSGDTASSIDVIEHTINFYSKQRQQDFDYIVLLEPTSPLRETDDIDLAIERLLESQAEAITGIAKTESQNPAFLLKMDTEGFLKGYDQKGLRSLRRQDINEVYFLEGTIYISTTEALLRERTFYHDKTIGYVVPKYKSLEIDDIDDLVMVEAIMKHKGY